MLTLAALLEFSAGFGLLAFGVALCMLRALNDGNVILRIGWAWAGGTWFAAVMLGTVEAIFHTLNVPLT